MKDARAIVRTAEKVADGVSGAIFSGELGRKREKRVRRLFIIYDRNNVVVVQQRS